MLPKYPPLLVTDDYAKDRRYRILRSFIRDWLTLFAEKETENRFTNVPTIVEKLPRQRENRDNRERDRFQDEKRNRPTKVDRDNTKTGKNSKSSQQKQSKMGQNKKENYDNDEYSPPKPTKRGPPAVKLIEKERTEDESIETSISNLVNQLANPIIPIVNTEFTTTSAQFNTNEAIEEDEDDLDLDLNEIDEYMEDEILFQPAFSQLNSGFTSMNQLSKVSNDSLNNITNQNVDTYDNLWDNIANDITTSSWQPWQPTTGNGNNEKESFQNYESNWNIDSIIDQNNQLNNGSQYSSYEINKVATTFTSLPPPPGLNVKVSTVTAPPGLNVLNSLGNSKITSPPPGFTARK